MKPADRVELITRCAGTLDGRGWSDIDFILGQFGIPTQDDWRDSSDEREFNYVRYLLGQHYNDDKDLLALDDYLHGVPTHDEDHEPWEKGSLCRVFITHPATQRATADAIKNELQWWGLDGFVAHKDIEPGAEWVRVIVAALHSCDALVALLHDGFKESNWCDQEVGVAFGRSIPVVPARIDVDPYGFLGMFQAIPWKVVHSHEPGITRIIDSPEQSVTRELVKILLADKRTSSRVVEAIVKRLEGSESFNQSNELSNTLAYSAGRVDVEQVARLRKAQKHNEELTRAYHVESALQMLESRLPQSAKAKQTPTPGPPQYPEYDYGEEPF